MARNQRNPNLPKTAKRRKHPGNNLGHDAQNNRDRFKKTGNGGPPTDDPVTPAVHTYKELRKDLKTKGRTQLEKDVIGRAAAKRGISRSEAAKKVAWRAGKGLNVGGLKGPNAAKPAVGGTPIQSGEPKGGFKNPNIKPRTPSATTDIIAQHASPVPGTVGGARIAIPHQAHALPTRVDPTTLIKTGKSRRPPVQPRY